MPVKGTSLRDRTSEFQRIGDRVKKSSAAVSSSASSTSNAPSSSGAVAAYDGGAASARSGAPFQTEFKRRVARIGQGIHQTSLKLSKLAQLAKRTSLYDDPALEIQELTTVIKQDITALNNAVVDLQLLSNSQNEAGSSSDSAAHSTKVVDDLKNSLMSTTKEFKEVLTKRTQNLKVHENRRQRYSSAVKESTNAFVRQRPLASTGPGTQVAPPPWASDAGSSSQLFQRNQTDGESQPLLQQQQSQLQQQQQMVPAQDYMQSRAESLHTIESTIYELGNIFTQLATMVSEQGEVAIRIDEHMEDTLTNVEGAQQQLVRYMNSISSNRWLMIKIFFVLVVFLMIFLFFVA